MNKEIKAYFDSVNPNSMKNLMLLRDFIFTAVFDAEEKINYNMPAYALVPNGKRDKQIMMAGYKNHVGLYPHLETIEHFSTRLEKYKYSKGAVQFSNKEELPKN